MDPGQHSTVAALVAAIGGLVGGIGSLIATVRARRRRQESSDAGMFAELLKMPAFNVGAILLLLSLNVSLWLYWSMRQGEPLRLPRNAELTAAAWQALNSGDYTTASQRARECIDEFEPEAVREQERLQSTPPPPTGAVDDVTRQRIIARGPLNDVGTSYFILGLAFERSGRTAEALAAYKAAQGFPHARWWDPHGWFNSPSEAAGDRIAVLTMGDAKVPSG